MRRLIGPALLVLAIVALLGWRLLWPERKVTLRVQQFDTKPVLLVELGTTALFGRIDRALIAVGAPVIKRYTVQSAYSRFVWVARDADGAYHAFVPKDPLSGCLLAYSAPVKQFHDPCGGAVYDLSGKLVAGPGTSGLWAYHVESSPAQITVDLAQAPTNQ
ncbi:MAG TPA: hypothetical protein VK191_04100 [Symbiobacteriaceae bacterium]|nr:hypothetical protein [Symbiobacteriaceae bacterium]